MDNIADIVNQLLETVKSSNNPELYYLAAAMVLLLAFYIVNKIIKLFIFMLIGVVLFFGYNAMQGKTMDQVVAELMDTFNQISGKVQSGSGTLSTIGKSSSSGSLEKIVDDAINKSK